MTDATAAACAVHFDLPAARTCTRCGRFCCSGCLSPEHDGLCVTCAPMLADPFGFTTRSFDFVTPFTAAVKLVWAELPKLLLLVALFSLSSALLQVALVPDGDDFKSIATSTRVSNLHDALLGLIGVQAILALLIARGEGRSLSLGAAFKESLGIWGRTLVARIRAGLWILLFVLLLVVPGIWKATTFMFVSIAVLRSQREDPLEASAALVRGRFWQVFGFGAVAFVGLYLPMFIVIMVLNLGFEAVGAPRFVSEYASALVAGFFVDVAMTAVLYVAYVMLHRTIDQPLGPMRWREVPPLATTD